MATIAVRVGREVKEISGLTNRTTCWDVVLALLKERQNLPGTESSAGGTNSAGGQGTEESTSSSSVSKSIKELAQSYVIVENWRGCEKPIPPRTRILNVWQAWGKEQRHVELSLKKSKHIRYRDGNNNGKGRHGSSSQDSTALQDDGATAHYSLHRLSQHQKRRIRRNLMQYQRAIMLRDEIYESDDLRNNENNEDPNEGANQRVLFNDAQPKPDSGIEPEKGELKNSDKRNGVLLSEEKFVDGVVTGPECLIKRADRAQLISQGNFNREFCKYRRRNHRRRGSVDGVVESRHHRRRHVHHYPYSSHHFRRRSSRHRSKNHKSGPYRYSTDDTTSTTTTTNTSEDENAEDADDEKSVLIEFQCPVPRRSHQYNVGIGGCNFGGGCAPATITDSSTTTSGDSMTSSIGCSTSSETSSGGDYFSTDPMSLFPSKRVTFASSPLQNMQNLKNINSTNNKPKKSKSLLGGLPKPALNLIESFRRTNLKRKSSKKANNQNAAKSETQNQGSITANKGPTNNPKTTDTNLSKAVPENEGDKSAIEPRNNSCVGNEVNKGINDASHGKSNTTDQCAEGDKETTVEDNPDEEELDKLAQVVISQNNVLENQQRRLAETDVQIQQIENDIHKLRTRALGKNYVQDTYLSGLNDTESNLANSLDSLQSSSSTPITSAWLMECDNVELLEQYIRDCDKIVEMQIQIEQYQRKSEIILQEMQEEVWRVSTNTTTQIGQDFSPVSKAAALMLGLNDEDEASDDEMRHEELSVTNCSFETSGKNPQSASTAEHTSARIKNLDAVLAPAPLELEISRTELEASLYLSLRLAAELEEIEQRLRTSETLVQKKGENLIKCVRDMAVSDEGIELDVWNEYGELLTAYDLEVQERIYLDMLERAQMAEIKAKASGEWNETEDTHYIDATSPNPTSHLISDQQKQHFNLPSMHQTQSSEVCSVPVTDPSSMNQALSPCVWCEHCKVEENKSRSQGACANSYMTQHHNHHIQHQPPTLFSELPLPRPVTTKKHCMPSVITPGLLPMLPLPDGLMSSPRYDSDYEDLPDLPQTKISETDKGGVEKRLGKDAEPTRDIGIRPNSLQSDVPDCSSNNTDDSGNASAGSTSSFASSDGSRNSSCDGGSPRPLPSAMDNQGSNSLFGRNGVLRGSWKGHFVFPGHAKQNSFQQVLTSSSGHVKATSKQKLPPPPPPPASAKPTLKRPDLPPKPSMTHKHGIKELEQHDILMQQQKLIRRNSGGRKKNYSVNHPVARYNNPMANQESEKFQTGSINSNFAPRGGSFKNSNSGSRGLKEALQNSCDKSKGQFPKTSVRNGLGSMQQHSSSHMKPVQSEHSIRANSNYDNDSDTGRSSLHSVDSDPIMCSETLV